MANTVELHRALALNDSDDTQLFTFLLSVTDSESFRQNQCRSSLFYYQGHEWYLTCGGFDDKEGVPQLGVFLYWTGTKTAGLRCRADYRIIVRNVQDPAESLISEGQQVLFNPPKSLGWGKRGLGPLGDILSVSKGFLVEPSGTMIVELALKSGKTIFEQTVDISQIMEEPQQADNLFKSYFTPNFSLAGFEFYLSVYPFGDREEAGGHVSMYLHRYIKTGHPHLGCRIRYRFFIGGHVSPKDSKTFEFSFKNDHGYGRFKAFDPMSSTDLLRRGPVPVGVEILSIASYAQVEVPLITRGYYHTDNFVFEDVSFSDHRGNRWKMSVNNTAQALCFRLDAEDKTKLSLNSNYGNKEEKCSKYLQSQILVQSRMDNKKSVGTIGGPMTAYFSQNLPDKTFSIATEIPVAKAKALDGEYCTKEEPSLSVRVELLNVQDLPGVMKDYPVLEFERFRLYHTREGLRKCLEQNEQMRVEMEKLREQQHHQQTSSSSSRNHVDDFNSMFPKQKPFEDGPLVSNSPVVQHNKHAISPVLSPGFVSSASPAFPAFTTSATTTTMTTQPAHGPVQRTQNPTTLRAHSPTMRSHSPTPTAESSGPAQFVMLPGDDDDDDIPSQSISSSSAAMSSSTSHHHGVTTSSTITSGAATKPRAQIAQSYVGIVSGPARLPVSTSVSNAPISQINLHKGFDVKPKIAIAQSYVGIVSPTARTAAIASSSATIKTTVPQIRLQPSMDIKPQTRIAQSYVGVVNVPSRKVDVVNAPSRTTPTVSEQSSIPERTVEESSYRRTAEPYENSSYRRTVEPPSMVISSHSDLLSYPYETDLLSVENKPAPNSYSYDNQRHFNPHATTQSGDHFDSSDFGKPMSSDLAGSVQSLSSSDFDTVSGDSAPQQRRVYAVEPTARSSRTNHLYTNETPVIPRSINSTASTISETHEHHQSGLKTSQSQKSVQFATELTKEYKVNTKKPVSKLKMPVSTFNETHPTKPILSSPKSPTRTRVTSATDTKMSTTRHSEAAATLSAQFDNPKKSLANKAWAKPTVFSQMVSSQQREQTSTSVTQRPTPQIQVSNHQIHQQQGQSLTTGQAPAPQTVSFNSVATIQEPSRHAAGSGHAYPSKAKTLPQNWTPSITSQNSDSSHHSMDELHLYTMPDLNLPPALPPRNGSNHGNNNNRKQPSRSITSTKSESALRGSPAPRSSQSLQRSSAFGPPLGSTGLDKRTFSSQSLAVAQLSSTRALANNSPTPSVTQVSTRRNVETTFGTIERTSETSRQLPQAQVAHHHHHQTARHRSTSDASHIGHIETNL